MRLFVAIELNEEFRKRLVEMQDALRSVAPEILPERGPIRIVGAAVDGGEKLISLQNTIEEACAAKKIPRENRKFRPHITLARARRALPRSGQARLLGAIAEMKLATMQVG